MGIIDAILEGVLGGAGKRIGSWLPSKESLMRRKIKGYEDEIKEIQKKPCTSALAYRRDKLDKLLREERDNLDRYLAT